MSLESDSTTHPEKVWFIYESTQPGEKLRQGDLIFFEESKNPLRSYGIIVTADCDLEHSKHGNMLTLVPLITPKSAAEFYIFPEYLSLKKSIVEPFVRKICSISKDDSLQDFSVRADLELQLESLDEKSDKMKILAIRVTLDQLTDISTLDYENLFKEIKLSQPKYSSVVEKINKKGDLFILPESNGVYGIHVPRIAWIRNIWQEELQNIVFKNSEQVKNPQKGQRIGRLLSPFIYSLTQKMARVFSDIGLPSYSEDISESELTSSIAMKKRVNTP